MKSWNARFRTMMWGFFCALFLIFAAAGGTEGAPAVQVAGGMVPAPAGREDGGRGAEDIALYATAAVLMDADSGRVLFGRNEDTPMAMASTTKILTCIIVLENASPEETVSVSAYAASMPKVKLYVNKGEQYTVGDLLYSLMLESHNDSAVVLAEHVGHKLLEGGLAEKPVEEHTVEESKKAVSAFAGLMNEKAVELGCKDSWFITPNGLDATQEFTLSDGTVIQKEHCTTAAELALIMSYCIGGSPESETFLKITRAANHSFSANGRSYSCVNHNAFLGMMDGALSGKTGFTNKAGYCYVGSLRRDGRTFVVALLACGWPNNKGYKWSDTRKLMQYGVDNYFYRSFLEEGTAFDESLLKPVPVLNGQTDVLGGTAYAHIAIAEEDSGGERGQAGTAGAGKTGTGNAEARGPESGKAGTAGAGKTEVGTEEAGGLGTGTMEAGGSGTGTMEAGGPGTGTEEAGGPGTGNMEGGRAKAGNMEAGGMESGKTKAGTEEAGGTENGKAEAAGPAERDVEGLLLRGDEEVRVDYSWEKTLTAPVKSGTKIGAVTYSVDGKVYRTEEIVTTDEVDAVDFSWCLRQVLGRFLLPSIF